MLPSGRRARKSRAECGVKLVFCTIRQVTEYTLLLTEEEPDNKPLRDYGTGQRLKYHLWVSLSVCHLLGETQKAQVNIFVTGKILAAFRSSWHTLTCL